ncbi:ribonuclease III domain-containing protein [Russula earlei]|uniref:Ribonuclease III domain-containing protein n=1 Tax=Russula earlei TaxID=71964 RepID=A0ACC0UPP7_9AGAM|nr:ribonuclease III domain-containing protein [Russula earlei]
MPLTPPLPTVQSEATLAIFVHSSLQSPVSNARFGNSERLAFIGNRALNMVIADILFEKRPMLSEVELDSELDDALSDEAYNQWVTHYGLRDRVICNPDQRDELKSSNETRHLFDAYVGAVYIEKGYPGIKAWIHPLIDPDYDPNSTSSGLSTEAHTGNPPPPANPPPPLPDGNSFGLATFNEKAMHRGVKVEWGATPSGPPHALTWSVECIVNGISKGTGTGKNKQQAKEMAARQAYQAMGWAGGLDSYRCTFSPQLR